MTKEEIEKEISESLRQFIGKSVNQNTVANIKGVLASQMQELMNRRSLIRPAPTPVIKVNGNEVDITFVHPVTGKMLTQQDFDHWLNGGYL